jgi:transposase
MIGAGRRIRVFASTRPTDMRKSFDTLSQVVISELGGDPLSGDVYLFVNARCTRAKCLLWDGTGLCIYQKRLERNRFAAPWKRTTDGTIAMTMSELALFLEGSKLVFIGSLSPDEIEPHRVVTKPLLVPSAPKDPPSGGSTHA